MALDTLRRQILAARESRSAAIAAWCGRAASGSTTLVFLSLNLPGPDKAPPWAAGLAAEARDALLRTLRGSCLVREGLDALGPFAMVACPGEPASIKRRAVALEESLPAGRLVDLDVYGADGVQVDRRTLGVPPRRCLVCDEPAADCIRLRRHGAGVLTLAAAQLAGRGESLSLKVVQIELAEAARVELDLTPKPGLVDRLDNGSHPDLSHALMARSIDLLPAYYDELIEMAGQSSPDGSIDVDACIAAGRRAEDRMTAAIGANTHRGYIFLSGLVLLAFATDGRRQDQVRATIADLAGRVLLRGRRPAPPTHGDALRQRMGVGGIYAEALDGLPSVFECGLPALHRGLTAHGRTDTALHYAMAALMTRVEDTTALHRAGRDGLDRLRRDGARLMDLIETGRDHLAPLAALNDDYRASRLTMGGVADCLAVTIAIERILTTTPPHRQP